ncbi:MAG: transglutaminase domain-containing protein [Planctomycetota bacterium]|jgi:tetratricopeptide (TPR) repeat protein/transglutaminase-like putative cysteine protease
MDEGNGAGPAASGDESGANFICPKCGAKATLPDIYNGCMRPCPACGERGWVGQRTESTPPRRPTRITTVRSASGERNTLGLRALQVVALSIVGAIASVILPHVLPGQGTATLVCLGATAFFLLTAGALSFLAIFQLMSRPHLYRSGKGQTYLAFALSGLTAGFLVCGLVLGWIDLEEGVESAPPPEESPVESGEAAGKKEAPKAAPPVERPEPRIFEDLNFRFDPPGDPWVKGMSRIRFPNMVLSYCRSNPSAFFAVCSSRPGPNHVPDQRQIVKQVKAQLGMHTTTVDVLDERAFFLGDLKGQRLVFEVEGLRESYLFIRWFHGSRGFLYQMTAWGPRSQFTKDSIVRMTTPLFAGFSILDAERIGKREGAAITEPFQSSDFPYAVDLTGTDWTEWDALEYDVPGAEFGALQSDMAYFLVVPIHLGSFRPLMDDLVAAMLDVIDIPYPTSKMSTRESRTRGDFEGIVLDHEDEIELERFQHRLQVWTGKGYAFLLAGWVPKSRNEQWSEVLDAFRQVRFLEASEEVEAEDYAEHIRFAHGQVFNFLGNLEYEKDRNEEAVDYYSEGFRIEANPTILSNLVNVLRDLGRNTAALGVLEAGLTRIPVPPVRLRLRRAALLESLGRKNEALEALGDLFRDGCRDEWLFNAYIGLLEEAERLTEAIEALREYRKEGKVLSLDLREVFLLHKAGRKEEADELLKRIEERYPSRMRVSRAWVRVNLRMERYVECLRAAHAVVERGDADEQILFMKAQAEFALGRFDDAKLSLEAALALNPDFAEAKALLAQTSGMLGEGENTSIKAPIDPVELPEALEDWRAYRQLTREDEEIGACYETRIRAITFEPGEDYRETDRYAARITSRRGIALFSTFKVAFNPLYEVIHPNEVVVRDAEGRDVSKVPISDMYVQDEDFEGIATATKVLHIPISGLDVGHRLEITVTKRWLWKPREFPYEAHCFSEVIPAHVSALWVHGNLDGVAVETSGDAPGRREASRGWLWTARRPPVLKREALQPSFQTYMPMVYVYDEKATWEKEVEYFLGLIDKRLQIDETVRETALRVTRDAKSDAEKTRVLASFVQDTLRYEAIEFGRRARVPHPADATLKNRYGDCKDHSLLLHLMLKAVGVESHLSLINSRHPAKLSIPTINQFDHMILFVPGYGGGHFFDCTGKSWALHRFPPFGLTGSQGLVLDPENPRFHPIPELDSSDCTVKIHRTLRPAENGDALVEETVVLWGWPASGLRTGLKYRTRSKHRTFIQELIAPGENLTLRELSVENLDRLDRPLEIHSAYRLRKRYRENLRWPGGGKTAFWERHFIVPGDLHRRTSPVRIQLPLQFESSTTIRPGKGAGGEAVKAGRWQGGKGSMSWAVESKGKGEALSVEFRYRMPVDERPPSFYKPFRASVIAAIEALEDAFQGGGG